MLRTLVAIMLTLLAVAALCGIAMAQDKDKDDSAKAAPKPVATTDANKDAAVIVVCPQCEESGGLCEECSARARALLTTMASSMCGKCTPEQPSEQCAATVEGAMALLPNLEVRIDETAPLRVAYIATTIDSSPDMAFGQMMQAATEQKLFGMGTQILGVFPDVMQTGYTPTMPFYACVSLPEGVDAAAPLEEYTLPGGRYMVVNHWGDYANLGQTWMAALAFADLRGLSLGTGPAGERYLSDPSSVPTEQWLTEVFIPLVGEPTPLNEEPQEQPQD
jgi:DNA gyrase inhibitor GyrI